MSKSRSLYSLSVFGNKRQLRLLGHVLQGAREAFTCSSASLLRSERFGLRRSPILCGNGKERSERVGPDISALNKTLQQQWNVAANAHLGRVAISEFSHKKVWWQCHQCPDGHLHAWQAAVSARSQGSGCPQCTGRKLCKHNSLATVAPKVAVFWDTARNGCTANMVLAYSKKTSYWQCHTCGHEWIAKPSQKVHLKSGCPVCWRQGQRRRRQSTFAHSQHPLLAEWDHQKNAAEGLFPDKITLRSAKKVHWRCNKCPLGEQHAWAATPIQRTSRMPTGCPFCAHTRACKCNSLQTYYPAVAAEWDYEKNDLTPSDCTAFSQYKAWWCSAARGSWQQAVHIRTKVVQQRASRKRYKEDNLAD